MPFQDDQIGIFGFTRITVSRSDNSFVVDTQSLSAAKIIASELAAAFPDAIAVTVRLYQPKCQSHDWKS